MLVNSPKNVPTIKVIITYWPYRRFFNQTPKGCVRIYSKEVDSELEEFRNSLATITSPDYPHRHIDNHSGWEVLLGDDTWAFFLFSDTMFYVFSMPKVEK